MKKGFTLIELLAVIILIGIVALIATPSILDVIDESKDSAVQQSADNYVKAIDIALSNSELSGTIIIDGNYHIMNTGNICVGELTDDGCDGNILEIKINGDRPTGGNIMIKDGEIINVSLIFDDKVMVMDVSSKFVYEDSIICKPATTSPTGNIPKGHLVDGDEYICEVKPNMTEGYHFFVVGTDGDNVSLILDSNITSGGSPIHSGTSTSGTKIAWISEDDYVNAGGTKEDYGTNGKNNKGPITALNYLMKATESWTNIPYLNETYIDENINYTSQQKGTTGYQSISLNGRARLPKYSEIHGIDKCLTKDEGNKHYGKQYGNCPLWLANYLKYDGSYSETVRETVSINGYWLMSSYSSSATTSPSMAWYVNYAGVVNGDLVNKSGWHGIRPVITISKANIALNS